MSKSPWGKVGAWAAEAERAEAEEREAAEKAAAAKPEPSFPSLKESVTTGTKQKKKTKMSLQEFTVYSPAPSRGLTHEEMLLLPTGPKERSAEEMHSGRLGGGFSNYGSNQGRPREYDGRRSYGFQEDVRNRGPAQSRVSELDQPSRADGVDNWASMKKQTAPEYFQPQSRPGGKYSSLGGGGGLGAPSRADEVDNWASDKKPISYPQQQSRSSSFGSGFSRPEPDRWTRNEQRFVLSSPKNDAEVIVKVNKPNPFGAARPREEVLAEKGLDWKKLDVEIEEKKQQHSSISGGSRPASSQSSRPESPLLNRHEVAAGVAEPAMKQKPKVNPFGDAKPREILLEEKGLDWKKIDLELEHRRVERSETEDEKNLNEEIKLLRQKLLQKSGNDQTSIKDLIFQKERELELLVRQLDDKIRYTRKIFERQGSGASRGSSFNGRPPSRSGAYEDPRAGYSERPHSRSGLYEDPRTGSLDRPPSQSGSYDDPRASFDRPPSRSGTHEDPRSGFGERPHSTPGAYEDPRGSFTQRSSFTPGEYQEGRAADYNERPRSRGSVNSWSRPVYDRRAVQGGGGRGFFGSRDSDRSGSRW